MLSILMAIVMVLTMMPFHPLKASAAETLNLGTPVRLSGTTYQLSNAAFGSTGVVNAGGGYFTVAVNNGSIAVGTLPSGITELTNGITISGRVTDQSTPANRVFNFSSGNTYEEIQEVIGNMTFTQPAGQTQSITVNVVPGAPLANGKTSVRTYNGRYFVYVQRPSTMTFYDAVTIATNNNGHLLEPTADDTGAAEMFAIANMFAEFKTFFRGSWNFISFIGATKTTAPTWASAVNPETRYVSNGNATGLENNASYFVPNGGYVHLTLLLDTTLNKVGYLAVDNTHGGSSAFKDPGVIVEYNSGFINNIITATKDVTVPTMGGSAVISGAAKFGETLTADLSGVTYTPSTSDNVPTYQWYRDGVAITNATGSSYMLTADDMGAAITVTVTSDGTHATGSVTSAATDAVVAADGAAAPAAPVETSKTTTSITLQAVAGQEYSNDGGVTWQDSPTFSGLTPETDYTFVTRVKATATNNASATSAGVTVRTSSSNADLSGLTLSSGNLSPAFAANTTDGYTSSVANSVSSLALTPTLSDGNATVTASVYNSEGTYGPIDLNGSAAGSLPLSVGVNTIKVVVTAQDGTTKTYTITVTRASSSNADLNGLTLSSGTLSPAFTAGTTDGYTSSVANSVSSTTVTATVYDSAHATVTASVYNSEGLVTGPITLTSGTASDSLPLSVGINTIKVVVTAQDGTTQTYTVTVTRASSSWTGSPGSTDIGSSTSDNSLSFHVIVNGKEYDQIATGRTTQENGKTVLTATVDSVKLEAQLAKEGDKPTIIVPAAAVSADKVTVVLTGEIVKAMENKQAILEVQTANGSYKLPAAQIAIDHLASQLGGQLKLSDIVINVDIAKSDTAKVQLAESMGEKGKFTVVVPPVDFTVTASYNGKTVDVDKFNVYVQREIPLPDGIDLSKITTATVLMADGTVYHVPTYITVRDGKYYAVVSSLTNSTYTLIWHPMTFADVANHWSKDAVNDMASRLIVNGVNETHYNPNAAITRAEFAAIIVRALGLPENGKTVPYGDVKSSDWFIGAVAKAQEYGIIKGYEDGTFRPSKTITRVEAMAMIARAMKLTGLDTNVSSVDAVSVLSSFVDGTAVDAWAKQAAAAAVKNGLVKGSEGGLLPKRNITRAETAVIVQRMLIKANLIDNKNSK